MHIIWQIIGANYLLFFGCSVVAVRSIPKATPIDKSDNCNCDLSIAQSILHYWQLRFSVAPNWYGRIAAATTEAVCGIHVRDTSQLTHVSACNNKPDGHTRTQVWFERRAARRVQEIGSNCVRCAHHVAYDVIQVDGCIHNIYGTVIALRFCNRYVRLLLKDL